MCYNLGRSADFGILAGLAKDGQVTIEAWKAALSQAGIDVSRRFTGIKNNLQETEKIMIANSIVSII